MTDASFAPACDVNNIVKHYQTTGHDPHQDRIAQARYDEASTLTYADAMRHKAALDSYGLENPNWDTPPEDTQPSAVDDTVVAEPAPQDSSEVESE